MVGYFGHDIFSNSFLTILKDKIRNKDRQRKLPDNPIFFQDGTEFENGVLYGMRSDKCVINRMADLIKQDSLYLSLINHPDIKIQHEFYVRFYGLWFKCKTDLVIKGDIVIDLKSTSAKSYTGFLKSVSRFDYDRQIYVYMTMAKCNRGLFIASSKEKKPKKFLVFVKKGDSIYNSGKRKTEELIDVLKSVI